MDDTLIVEYFGKCAEGTIPPPKLDVGKYATVGNKKFLDTLSRNPRMFAKMFRVYRSSCPSAKPAKEYRIGTCHMAFFRTAEGLYITDGVKTFFNDETIYNMFEMDIGGKPIHFTYSKGDMLDGYDMLEELYKTVVAV